MRTILLLISLALMPVLSVAQNDSIQEPVPPTPPVAPVPPTPPVPPVPPIAPEVVPSDTVRSSDRYLHIGVNAKDGGYVKIEEGDSTKRKDPVIIDLKHKTIKIYADDKEEKVDSIRIKSRLKELRTERRNLFTYWAGIDLGVNTLLDTDGDASFLTINNARSRFLAINFMEQKIEFGSHHVGFMTGLGWEFVNYHMANNVFLAHNPDSLYGVALDSPQFNKNKLRQMGFRVPLMLEFNTKKAPLPTEEELLARKKVSYSRKGNFHIAMGVVGSVYVETMYKQKYRQDGERRKDNFKGERNLLPYRAAASVRLGYGGLNLFGEYALTGLLRDGTGPQVTPFNVGLTIIGFN
jgi:hypothetical protein